MQVASPHAITAGCMGYHPMGHHRVGHRTARRPYGMKGRDPSDVSQLLVEQGSNVQGPSVPRGLRGVRSRKAVGSHPVTGSRCTCTLLAFSQLEVNPGPAPQLVFPQLVFSLIPQLKSNLYHAQ